MIYKKYYKTKVPFSVSLVVPIYNNDKTCEKILQACYIILKNICNKFEIILCNDGSFDNTGLIIEKFVKAYKNIKVIKHKKNKGIAVSLKDLYYNANCEYIILFSADGGWDTNDIIKLIDAVLRYKTSIVIGVRKNKKYTFIRHIISFMYNFLPVLVFGKRTYDAGSVKIFKSELFKKIKVKSKSVFFEAELLIKAQQMGYIVKTIHVNHRKSIKKFKSGVNIREVGKALLDILRLRFEI